MPWLSRLRRSFAVLLRRDGFDRDLQEEIQSHLDMQAEEDQASGLSAPEARLAARRRFGNPTLLAEESRAAWGWTAAEHFLRDVEHALRMLVRNPGFTLAAILTLALGVGANTAVFSILDAFLFRPTPLREAARLVSVADRTPQHSGRPISWPNFEDWQRHNQVFERMAAYRVTSVVFADSEAAARAPALEVSRDFFGIFGVRPALGRGFDNSEHAPGGAPAAIISHELWQRRFAADPAVLGRVITIHGGDRAVIVGVAPAGFRIGPRADIYTPIEQQAREGRGSANSLYAVGRLKPGVTLAQAQAQMDAIARRLEELYPKTNQGHRVDLMPFGRLRRAEIRPFLLMLSGAVGLVLLIACANISNLLLAKAAGRGREVAVRRALGAGRARLVAQMLTESLVLSVLGGAAGLLFGFWGCRGLLLLAGDLNDWPGGAPLGSIGLDARVFAFTFTVALLSGLLIGLLPALHASKASLASRAATRESRRTLDLLVVSEVALALVLLTGAGLLMRSLYYLLAQPRGFDAAHVLTFSLAPSAGRQNKDTCQQIIQAVQSLPGVVAAAGAFPLPFGHGFSGDQFWPEDALPGHRPVEVRVRYVTPGYFKTLGIRLVAGREGTLSDNERAVVVNEVLAQEAWGNRAPLGRRFQLARESPDRPFMTVVGVAAATRENGLDEDPPPEIYLPVAGRADILVRTAGDPLATLRPIRERILAIDRAQHVYDIFLLEDRISESVRGNRVFACLLGAFAVLALLLAAVGIYAVIAHWVSRRTQEFGVRVALGARPADVRRLVLRQGMLRVGLGLAFGTGAAAAAGRFLRSMLYGIRPGDPVTHVSVAALLALVALLACYLPARRATRIDPVQAIRQE